MFHQLESDQATGRQALMIAERPFDWNNLLSDPQFVGCLSSRHWIEMAFDTINVTLFRIKQSFPFTLRRNEPSPRYQHRLGLWTKITEMKSCLVRRIHFDLTKGSSPVRKYCLSWMYPLIPRLFSPLGGWRGREAWLPGAGEHPPAARSRIIMPVEAGGVLPSHCRWKFRTQQEEIAFELHQNARLCLKPE